MSKNANFRWIAAALLLSAACLLPSACTNTTPDTPNQDSAVAQTAGAPALGQATFASDADACDAMLAAVKIHDHDKVHLMLGPAWKELVSGDKVEDANAFDEFAQRAAEQVRYEKQNDHTTILHLGKDDWPFAIPVAKAADGKWFFDTEAGKNEILARRIGTNELDAIEICKKYVNAQREYAAQDRDGGDVLKYAQRILSTPGKKDGLYWESPAGQDPSPLAHLFAAEEKQGYDPTAAHPREPLHGYHFRVLRAQGPAAPGGKFSYVINGNMVAGFALVAFPTEYESSGIMTFIVNRNGKIYQKDLGQNTTDLARKMTEYNPDNTWTLVKD